MASSQEYLDYVRAQADGPWTLRARKMFGDWMVYADDRPILLVCDNTVFVKIVPELAALMADAERGLPYEGAKEHYILDVEDHGLTERVLTLAEAATPIPKPRKKGRGEK